MLLKVRRPRAAPLAPWARGALSAVLLAAASPATAAEAPARDARGEPVRAADGGCIDAASAAPSVPDPRCASGRRRTTFRILQNLIPQPSVTYSTPGDATELAGTEVLRFAPGAGFVPGHSTLTLELREELLAMLLALEAYRYVDRFELTVHADDRPNPAFGQWLAERRLAQTRDNLLQRGVVAPMILHRVAPPGDPALRQRVEIAVTVRDKR